MVVHNLTHMQLPVCSLSVETPYYFMNDYWQALSSTCSLFLKDRLSILNHVH